MACPPHHITSHHPNCASFPPPLLPSSPTPAHTGAGRLRSLGLARCDLGDRFVIRLAEALATTTAPPDAAGSTAGVRPMKRPVENPATSDTPDPLNPVSSDTRATPPERVARAPAAEATGTEATATITVTATLATLWLTGNPQVGTGQPNLSQPHSNLSHDLKPGIQCQSEGRRRLSTGACASSLVVIREPCQSQCRKPPQSQCYGHGAERSVATALLVQRFVGQLGDRVHSQAGGSDAVWANDRDPGENALECRRHESRWRYGLRSGIAPRLIVKVESICRGANERKDMFRCAFKMES